MKDTNITEITVNLSKVKAAFVAGLKSFYTAKDAIKSAFDEAVPLIMGTSKANKAKKKLRDTLIQWGEEAGLAKKTVANTVSSLMVAAKLELRKRGSKVLVEVPPSAEVLAAVAELMEFCGENIERTDLAAVLELALEQLRDAEENETEVEEKAEKAA